MHYSYSKSWDFCVLPAGILLTLSFAPFDYSSFALIALAILFASWRNVSAKRAALRGYLFGLGAFGSGVSWVYISMHDFGGANVFGSSLLTGLFAGFWALFPALSGYLSVKTIPINKGFARVVGVPAVWILIEYLRGYWVLNGFPWLHVAYSQLEMPLAGYIAVAGVYGTGFILALTASIVVEIVWATASADILLTVNHSYAKSAFPSSLRIMQAVEHCRGGFLSPAQIKPPLHLIMMLAVLWGTGGLLRNITWTHQIGPPIRVSMIQGNIAQDQKWRPENKISTLLKYKKMTEEHWDSQAIIWPETAIPAFLDQVQETFLAPLRNNAKLHNTDLIISVPVHDRPIDQKYNAVITIGKDEDIYRKTHLLPFGEYLPLQPLSGFVLNMINIKLGNFTAGTASQPLLKAGGYPFITLICYEDVFGDLGIRGLPDAAYLVNVTNDGWFGNSIEPHQHMQMARMRAIETGRFLLRATNTGMTGIVSPKGEIVSQAPLFQETALTGTITPMGGMTPYARWGDKPVIGVMVILLLGFMGYSWFFRN
ncbi:apolipoprotein N-acyltransferase [Methylobacter sp.]|uniref:apolipoprotein N-acyltransferase n=1 Tax=Methylobacter sp. TaxID=2051955 RepID=UPI00120A9C38|nr:apolipoprotein N-acyltransferase [Methylobacter sp.]TAK63504.1 MAG: apolipoprotein N-acyltransferase [Methylobacter sp.]